MGITDFSLELLKPIMPEINEVIELGSQNLYCNAYKYGIKGDQHYKQHNKRYVSIDLNGENNALKIDLSKKIDSKELGQFDLVTDFGTSEHVSDSKGEFSWQAIHNCWKTKHALCKEGGYIVSENPKTGNWPKHGLYYYTQEFYTELAKAMGYEIVKIGEHAAMNNTTDGWNVYCILKKVNKKPFLSIKRFKELSLCTS